MDRVDTPQGRQGAEALSSAQIFLIWFVLGTVTMMLLKVVLGVNQIWVTIPPLGIMLIYGRNLYIESQYSARPERAGDNIYYLGFLFTLVSLALALYEFGRFGDDRAGLISNFSIALATTIAGVLGRVLLNQGEKEIDEYEVEAKVHLAQEIDEFKTNLIRSRESITEFNDSTIELMSKHRNSQIEQIANDQAEASKHMIKLLEDIATSLHARVEKTSHDLDSRFDEVAAQAASHVSTFSNSVSDLGGKTDELRDSLSKVALIADRLGDIESLLEERSKAIASPINEVSRSVDELVNQQKALVTATAAASEKLATQLDDLSRSVVTVIESVAKSTEVLYSPVEQALMHFNSLGSGVEMVTEAVVKLSEASENAADAPKTINTSLAQLKPTIDSLDNELKALGQSIAESRSGYLTLHAEALEAMETENKELRSIEENRTSLNESIQRTNENLQKTVGDLQLRLDEVSKAMIEMAEFIGSQAN